MPPARLPLTRSDCTRAGTRLRGAQVPPHGNGGRGLSGWVFMPSRNGLSCVLAGWLAASEVAALASQSWPRACLDVTAHHTPSESSSFVVVSLVRCLCGSCGILYLLAKRPFMSLFCFLRKLFLASRFLLSNTAVSGASCVRQHGNGHAGRYVPSPFL